MTLKDVVHPVLFEGEYKHWQLYMILTLKTKYQMKTS